MSTPGVGAREMHGIPDYPAPTRLSVAHHTIAGEVLAELDRAMAKFPSMNSMHEGWAILQEEVDELNDEMDRMWSDVKANRWPEAMAEAQQVAAMAIRFIHDMRAIRSAEEAGA